MFQQCDTLRTVLLRFSYCSILFFQVLQEIKTIDANYGNVRNNDRPGINQNSISDKERTPNNIDGSQRSNLFHHKG